MAAVPVQDALTAAVAGIAQCEVPESLVHQMGEGECVPGRHTDLSV